jgi:hypothetical protein
MSSNITPENPAAHTAPPEFDEWRKEAANMVSALRNAVIADCAVLKSRETFAAARKAEEDLLTWLAAHPAAPKAQEVERIRANDWGLTKAVAMSLKPFLRPGEKVIWREPFRWKGEDGVLSNHYESMSLAALAEDFNFEIAEDFKHAAIIRPLGASKTIPATRPEPK